MWKRTFNLISNQSRKTICTFKYYYVNNTVNNNNVSLIGFLICSKPSPFILFLFPTYLFPHLSPSLPIYFPSFPLPTFPPSPSLPFFLCYPFPLLSSSPFPFFFFFPFSFLLPLFLSFFSLYSPFFFPNFFSLFLPLSLPFFLPFPSSGSPGGGEGWYYSPLQNIFAKIIFDYLSIMRNLKWLTWWDNLS